MKPSRHSKDQFTNHLLPDKLHMLSVSLLVPEICREFGGCAGNIAYNLYLLGDTTHTMATAGHNFGPHLAWMGKKGVAREVLADAHTGQVFITLDLDNRPSTAPHPGTMEQSHLNSVGEAKGIALGTVAQAAGME